MDLFWRQGYAATSLDELTAAMRLSRSSFYACFGSKRGVLIRALKDYAAASLEILETLRTEHADPREGIRAMVRAIAAPGHGPRGCLMVNCITELALGDEEVAALARRHIGCVEAMFADLIVGDDLIGGEDRAGAERKAGALVALSMGAITMRKSGIADERIEAVLDLADPFLPMALSHEPVGAGHKAGRVAPAVKS